MANVSIDDWKQVFDRAGEQIRDAEIMREAAEAMRVRAECHILELMNCKHPNKTGNIWTDERRCLHCGTRIPIDCAEEENITGFEYQFKEPAHHPK